MAATLNLNPYQVFASSMYSTMYPALGKGTEARTTALYCLLAYLLVLSVLSILVTVRKSRREKKETWIWRSVTQHQGTYVLLNQHFFFPIGSLILAVWWIIYTRELARMWAGADNQQIQYLLSFVAIPAFAHAWVLTFSVISGANLASARPCAQGVRHLLSPKVANSVLILLPGLLIALFVTGARTGGAFKELRKQWDVAYDHIMANATTYDGTGNFTQIITDLTEYVDVALVPDFLVYRSQQKVGLITSIVCFCILILINVGGGVALVASLRQSDGHLTSTAVPLVAPLAEYDNGHKDKEASPVAVPAEWHKDPEAYRADVAAERKAEKGDRLGWDVTLYYFSVPVVSAAYLAYAIWVLARPGAEGPKVIEISALIIPWGYGGISALSMTSVMIKSFFFEKKRVTAHVVSTFDRLSSTVSRSRSARERGWTDSIVGPLEGISEEEAKHDDSLSL